MFNLFVPSDDPKRSNMRYRLWFRDGVGAPFTLEGHKDIEDHAGLDLWKDTTTLFTTVLRGHVEEGARPGRRRRTPAASSTSGPPTSPRQVTTFRGDTRCGGALRPPVRRDAVAHLPRRAARDEGST